MSTELKTRNWLPTRLTLLAVFVLVACGPGAMAETVKDPVKNVKKGFPSTAPAPSASTVKPAAPKPVDPAVEKSLYQEILQVLQERYAEPTSIGPKKITESAVGALLDSLKGTARLIEPETVPSPSASAPPLVDSACGIDPFIGYVRVHALEEGTARQLQDEVQKMIQQQHISSLILDLRFGRGTDFAVVPAVAAPFFADSRELFTIQRSSGLQGYGTTPSIFNTNLLLIVLVNQETQGTAEVLAGCLQDQGRAILIGRAPTAGAAYETTDTRLSNGRILRYASGKVTLPHKGDFFLKGAHPDITVTLDPKSEKDIHGKPFQPPALRVEARYFSEAILTGRDLPPPSRTEDSKTENNEPASNKDAVLQRAIDLLKGISALQL